jgi:hypothetical protein
LGCRCDLTTRQLHDPANRVDFEIATEGIFKSEKGNARKSMSSWAVLRYLSTGVPVARCTLGKEEKTVSV